MRLTIAQLRAAGVSDKQIVDAMAEAEAERREQNRIAQRNHRARQQNNADRADRADTALSLSKEVKVYPKEESKKVSKKTKKEPLPENWQPIGPQRDPVEPDEFRDHARAKGYQYSDWHAAYRNFQRSPYNPRNKLSTAKPASVIDFASGFDARTRMQLAERAEIERQRKRP